MISNLFRSTIFGWTSQLTMENRVNREIPASRLSMGRPRENKTGRWARVSSAFAHFGEEDILAFQHP
jgi:hypothetical protein